MGGNRDGEVRGRVRRLHRWWRPRRHVLAFDDPTNLLLMTDVSLAGMSTAIKLKQLANEAGDEVGSIFVPLYILQPISLFSNVDFRSSECA